MVVPMRILLFTTIPATLLAVLGLLWFRRKKSDGDRAIDFRKPPDKGTDLISQPGSGETLPAHGISDASDKPDEDGQVTCRLGDVEPAIVASAVEAQQLSPPAEHVINADETRPASHSTEDEEPEKDADGLLREGTPTGVTPCVGKELSGDDETTVFVCGMPSGDGDGDGHNRSTLDMTDDSGLPCCESILTTSTEEPCTAQVSVGAPQCTPPWGADAKQNNMRCGGSYSDNNNYKTAPISGTEDPATSWGSLCTDDIVASDEFRDSGIVGDESLLAKGVSVEVVDGDTHNLNGELHIRSTKDDCGGSSTAHVNWHDNSVPQCVEQEVSAVTAKTPDPSAAARQAGGSVITADSPHAGSTSSGSTDSNCDARSEVSADSGKGGSVEGAVSPTRDLTIYEFDFPSDLCGRLIGRKGHNINQVKDQCGVEILIKRKNFTGEYQLVSVEGTQAGVEKALKMLKQRFPPKRFDVSYDQVAPDGPILSPELMQLTVPVGVTVDCVVSSVVAANHVFVQQPTHPTFPMLEKQNHVMMMCYSQDGIVPQLPRPIEVGVICAAPMYNGWYRALIVQTYADVDEVDIRFVDYGGYTRVQGCTLRQIRSDFTTLPFQAVECYLSNVVHPKGLEGFPLEAAAVLEELVQGRMLQAEVMGLEEDGVPYIQLYDIQGDSMTLLNRELVNRGVAQWMEHSM